MSLKKPEFFETAIESYKTVEVIGEGGSGIVYRVETDIGQDFAIKCLKPEIVNSVRLRRFHNELRFSLKNTHRNIVTVLDYGSFLSSQRKIPFYVMDYYPSTLREMMKAEIIEDQITNAISQILDGLEAAHFRGTWHRDIKPENILYESQKNLFVISDFGIAHFSDEELITAVETKSSERLANFKYAAPEQRNRDRVVDGRADIYSVGLIINELFTRQLAQGTNYRTIKSVSPNYSYLDELVDEMIRSDPMDRIYPINEIKKKIISFRKEYVTRQRLSEINNEVIPTYGVDDPLVLNPIELESIDYLKGKLHLLLNQTPNRMWINAFTSITKYQNIRGMGPPNISFEENLAYIPLPERDVQNMVNFFKDYLVKANNRYASSIREENIEKGKFDREHLKKEREDEERRLRIIRNTKI